MRDDEELVKGRHLAFWNEAKREGHPLMRQPEECIQCRRWHLPTEPCRKTAYCVNCGDVAGIFAADACEDRECWRCIRERAE